MVEWLFTYAGQVVGGVLTFLALWKDAKDYGDLSKKWGRWIIGFSAFAILFLFCASIYLTHLGRAQALRDKANAQAEAAASKAQIETLSSQIVQMSKDRAAAESGFRESFAQLSQKVANLQTKAATQELSKQLSDTRTELREAQAKLVQPKAILVPSLWTLDPSQLPLLTTAAKLVGNSVTIDFFVFNKSDVAAVNGSIFIRICSGCKFAKEPEGFSKIRGVEDYDREFSFANILPHTGIHKLTAEVIPPESAGTFEFDITSECQSCEAQDRHHFFVTVQK